MTTKSKIKRVKGVMTDTKRLDWLEENGFGAALINDDNGHWTVAFDGTQNVPEGKSPIDIVTSHFIKKGKWRKNIRDAIDAAIAEHDTGEIKDLEIARARANDPADKYINMKEMKKRLGL